LGVRSASANLLLNSGFEANDASAGDVAGPATDWGQFNAGYISAAHAHTGTNSLKQFATDAGEYQAVPAGPNQTWTATAWIMTSSTDQLSGPLGSNIQIQFLDASGNALATANPGLQFVSTDPADTWTQLTLADAPSVPGTAFAQILLFTGPYSGLPGTAGGSVFWDDASLTNTTAVPEPASLGLLAAAGLLVMRRRHR
jgi:hypothetical protein